MQLKDLNGRRTGSALYRHIIEHGFPDSFQVLCYNCNCAKRNRSWCPHQLIDQPTIDELEMVVGMG